MLTEEYLHEHRGTFRFCGKYTANSRSFAALRRTFAATLHRALIVRYPSTLKYPCMQGFLSRRHGFGPSAKYGYLSQLGTACTPRPVEILFARWFGRLQPTQAGADNVAIRTINDVSQAGPGSQRPHHTSGRDRFGGIKAAMVYRNACHERANQQRCESQVAPHRHKTEPHVALQGRHPAATK